MCVKSSNNYFIIEMVYSSISFFGWVYIGLIVVRKYRCNKTSSKSQIAVTYQHVWCVDCSNSWYLREKKSERIKIL